MDVEYRNQRRTIVCEICGEKFVAQRVLLTHLAKAHNFELPFKCDTCEKRFYSERARDRHVKAVHLNIPLDPKCFCDCCGKYFATPATLQEHKLWVDK